MPFNLSSNVGCFLHFFDLFSELTVLILQIKYLLLDIDQLAHKRNIISFLCSYNTILDCFVPSHA